MQQAQTTLVTCTISTPSAHSCSFLGIVDFGSDARLRAGVSSRRRRQLEEMQGSLQYAFAIPSSVFPYSFELQTVAELVPARAQHNHAEM